MPFFPRSFRPALRQLCFVLAVVTGLGPVLHQAAIAQETQSAEPAIEPTYIAPGACAAAVLRPRQLLTSEFAKPFPIEVVSAFGLQQLGFDPVDVESVLVTIGVPMGDAVDYAGQVTFAKDFDLASVQTRLPHHVEATTEGKTYLKSPQPNLPSYYQPAPNVVVAASERAMQRFLQERGPKLKGQLGKWFAESSADDVAVAVDLVRLSALVQLGVGQVQNEVPQEYQQFLELPSLLARAQVRLNLSGNGPTELVAIANEASDADRIEELIDEARKLYERTIDAQTATLLASEDPIQQAFGRYQDRMSEEWSEQLRPIRDGDRFTLLSVPEDMGEAQTAGMVNVAVGGILVALLLPAIQQAREAARQSASMNNLKNIILALLNYADANRRFPADAIRDEDGQALLSWRVAILPYIEEEALYKRFRLDEPWDSEHNKKLIPLMPDVYLDPSSGRAVEYGKTNYLGVSGEGTLFDPTAEKVGFASVRDGTSNTLAVVQVSDHAAEVWTKPAEWEFQPDENADGMGLGGLHPGIFLAAFIDGHVERISNNVEPATLEALTTRSGGEIIQRPY